MKPATIIAMDGPAASGKSTVAERLAKELGYLYFDTGVMYRAITLAALEQFATLDDEDRVTALAETADIEVGAASVADGRLYDVLLDGRDVTWLIRSEIVEAHVSQVSAYPGVRRAMTRQQRKIGHRGSVVMVGRDIGTVVLPEADLKIYLDASVEERARRRVVEVQARGGEANYQDILAAMKRRDEIDSTRAVAPLKPAEDAIIVNTDGVNIEEVVERIRKLVG
jgi:CMP/dCMP kinase